MTEVENIKLKESSISLQILTKRKYSNINIDKVDFKANIKFRIIRRNILK